MRFKSKSSLIEAISRVIWIATAQHAAINYPLSDYGSYIPNLSTKLYDVEGVSECEFTAARLQNRNTTAVRKLTELL